MSPRLRLVVRWLVALAVVGLLAWFVDLGSVAARLAGTDIRVAVPAIVGLVAVHVIAASAWRRLLFEVAGVSLRWGATLRLYYAAQALGTVTPANLGADVYRIVAVGGAASRGRLAQPVLVQRLTSILALVLFGGMGALALPIPGLAPFVAGLGALGVAVALASVVISRPGDGTGWGARIARRFGWDDAGTTDRGRLGSAIRDGLGLGLVFHGASLLLALLLVHAVDPGATEHPATVLGALAVARLSLALPISPNGIGIQEGALTILFVQLGLPAETALAAALLNRLAFLSTAALGAICLAAPSGAAAAAPSGTAAAAPGASSARPSGARAGGS